MPASQGALDRIRVHFATFRDVAADGRAEAAAALSQLPADERLLLETCHRVELVTVGGPSLDGSTANGRDAVRRIFEVVAGFDSAVMAEEQLLGQVRAAYRAAVDDGSTGPVLEELFRRALRFGRRVRSHAQPGTDRSLADRGVAWLTARLAAASDVVVAGTGEMGRIAAGRLASAGHRVTIVSRSSERGTRLLDALPGTGHRLHVGRLDSGRVRTAAGIVVAVRTREPLLTGDLVSGRPWVLDLSVPPAVAVSAAEILTNRLMTTDRLGGADGRDAAPVLAPRVERRLRRELDAEVDAYVAWLEVRGSADALAILHRDADAVRRRHLDRLRRGTNLAPDQVAAVEAASAAMLNELLERPSLELRRGGTDADTVRRLFGLGGRG